MFRNVTSHGLKGQESIAQALAWVYNFYDHRPEGAADLVITTTRRIAPSNLFNDCRRANLYSLIRQSFIAGKYRPPHSLL